jgi:hypothetical protein
MDCAAIEFGLPSYCAIASADVIGKLPVVTGASGKPLPVTSSDDPDCTAENEPAQLTLPGTTSLIKASQVFFAVLIHGGVDSAPAPCGTAQTYTDPTAVEDVLYLLSPSGSAVQSSGPDDVVALGHVANTPCAAPLDEPLELVGLAAGVAVAVAAAAVGVDDDPPPPHPAHAPTSIPARKRAAKRCMPLLIGLLAVPVL